MSITSQIHIEWINRNMFQPMLYCVMQDISFWHSSQYISKLFLLILSEILKSMPYVFEKLFFSIQGSIAFTIYYSFTPLRQKAIRRKKPISSLTWEFVYFLFLLLQFHKVVLHSGWNSLCNAQLLSYLKGDKTQYKWILIINILTAVK